MEGKMNIISQLTHQALRYL